MGILADIIAILEWLKKHPLEESAPNRGKFWPQLVGVLIGNLIVMVNVIMTVMINKEKLKNLWLDFNYSYFFNPLGLSIVVTVILLWMLGLPFIIGILLYRTYLSRIWRFFIGLLIPFSVAYFVRIIFFQ